MNPRILENYYRWLKSEENLPGDIWFPVRIRCRICGYRWLDAFKTSLPPCPRCGGTEAAFCFELPGGMDSIKGI